jgi:hypothetical protein
MDNHKEEPIPGRCGAKIRSRTGGFCKRYPLVGRTRCRLHGGATPRGVDSPHYKHGRYSKALPVRLLQNYEAAIADQERLALEDENALLVARLQELIKRIDAGGSGNIMRQLQNKFSDFEKAQRLASNASNEEQRQQRLAESREALKDIKALITQGVSDYIIWDEIVSVIDVKRKVVESERKRLVEMQQMITLGDAVVLMRALSEAVQNNVDSPNERQAVYAEFERILSRNGKVDLISG